LLLTLRILQVTRCATARSRSVTWQLAGCGTLARCAPILPVLVAQTHITCQTMMQFAMMSLWPHVHDNFLGMVKLACQQTSHLLLWKSTKHLPCLASSKLARTLGQCQRLVSKASTSLIASQLSPRSISERTLIPNNSKSLVEVVRPTCQLEVKKPERCVVFCVLLAMPPMHGGGYSMTQVRF